MHRQGKQHLSTLLSLSSAGMQPGFPWCKPWCYIHEFWKISNHQGHYGGNAGLQKHGDSWCFCSSVPDYLFPYSENSEISKLITHLHPRKWTEKGVLCIKIMQLASHYSWNILENHSKTECVCTCTFTWKITPSTGLLVGLTRRRLPLMKDRSHIVSPAESTSSQFSQFYLQSWKCKNAACKPKASNTEAGSST